MTKLRKIAAHYIYTPRGFLKQGVVTITQRGEIVSLESRENLDAEPNTEFYSGVIIPGMVNAHTHLELSYLKGAIERGGEFVGFAKGMGEKRELTPLESRVRAAELYDAKMWQEGVQAVGDICNGEITFELKKRSRIRYHSFIELFGLRTESAQGAMELLDKARKMGLNATVTPHSTYSLNQEMFAQAVGNQRNTPLSIHFMESRQESDLFDQRGEMWEWYQSEGMKEDFTDRYASPTERIIENIPAQRRILLVHSVHIAEHEIEELRQKYAKGVSFVVCPKSNQYIGVGRAPIELLVRSGVRVAVGTDSLASNTSLSIIEELKELKELSLDEKLHWATLAGAEALGVEREIGSIEVGKTPGIVLLTGVDYQTMELTDDSKTQRVF